MQLATVMTGDPGLLMMVIHVAKLSHSADNDYKDPYSIYIHRIDYSANHDCRTVL
jgi:hypothetical protein